MESKQTQTLLISSWLKCMEFWYKLRNMCVKNATRFIFVLRTLCWMGADPTGGCRTNLRLFQDMTMLFKTDLRLKNGWKKTGLKAVKWQKSLNLGLEEKGRFCWIFISNIHTLLKQVSNCSKQSIAVNVWNKVLIRPKKVPIETWKFYSPRKNSRHISLWFTNCICEKMKQILHPHPTQSTRQLIFLAQMPTLFCLLVKSTVPVDLLFGLILYFISGLLKFDKEKLQSDCIDCL